MLRTIVPDYARPQALMVPHNGRSGLRELFEGIATAAAEKVGVILLSNDPPATQAFVDAQPQPQHFTIVGANFDTPWIRDRAPLAVREAGAIRWLLPRLPPENRPLDDRLFGSIAARESETAPLMAAQGNIVAGPRGLALSTTRILVENGMRAPEELRPHAPAFGIRRWIVFDRFPDEPTGHADVHARFLQPGLLAVAWHPKDRAVQACAGAIEDSVRAAAPGIRVIRIPLAREGSNYASLANWIQIGRHILMPRYELTTDSDVRKATAALEKEGFRVRTIFAPTLELGGALHCLTASVYV